MTWRIGGVRVFRRTSSLSGSPGWLVLLALGWTIDAVDDRYWSVLMSREESSRTQSPVGAR